jgi:hypothetical protein
MKKMGPGPKARMNMAKDSVPATELKGYVGISRKKYDLGQNGKLGMKDVGVVNNTVQLETNKYSGDAAKAVTEKLSKMNPGMKFQIVKPKNKK